MANVYVNFKEKKVMSEGEFTAMVNELAQDYVNDDTVKEDYLSALYSMVELFNMTTRQKENVEENFNATCIKAAREDLLNSGWVYYSIE